VKAHTILETASQPATVAMMLGGANAPPPAILERASGAAVAAHSAPEATPDDSARFREDVPRRYEAAYPHPWHHGGLND